MILHPNIGLARQDAERKRFHSALLGAAMLGTLLLSNVAARADLTPQALPFKQDWSNVDLITVTQDWSSVPGIIGYRGDNLRGDNPDSTVGTNPQLILGDGVGTLVNVVANAANPTTAGPNGGGIYEFDKLDNPVVAFQGSGTGDAPHLVFTLNTTGNRSINVAYNLRDVDVQGSAVTQQVALQYRIGMTGNYIDVPTAYVANAAGAPGEATKVTPVSALLPDAANDQPVVQVRVITADANGSDELIGVDDINVTGTPIGGTDPTDPFIAAQGDPNSINQGGATLLSAKITPGTNPDSSGVKVTGDLTSIGGNATQQFFDDGTNGDATAGDNIFSYNATVTATAVPGNKSLPINVVDAQSRTAATTISLQVVQVFKASTTVVISEFRSRGVGGAGDEFVELYNLSGAAVDLSGYTLKYSTAGGSIGLLATVGAGVSLPAGAHYLFTVSGGPLNDQGDANFGGGIGDTGGLAIFDAAGSRVDAVGFNLGAPFTEGTGLAVLPNPNDTNQSYERLPLKVNNQDTENNVSDFQLTDSNPQSLKVVATPTNPTVTAQAAPVNVQQGGTTLLTATVTPGTNPTSSAVAVTGDLTTIGGSVTQQFFDDGTNGDATAGDNVYSYNATVPAATATGTKSLPINVVDEQGRTATTAINLTVLAPNLPPSLNNATYTTSSNVAFSQQLPGSDPENDVLTYTLSGGGLPTDITLTTRGLLSGTPTVAGRYDFSVNVTDSTNTITSRFIIIVSAVADGVGPRITRAALTSPTTRDALAASTLTGTITDIAPAGVTPSGVSRMLFQIRRNSDGFSYSGPTDGFTANVNRGYYPGTLGASSDGTTAGTRNFSRNLSFLPQLAPGAYTFNVIGQDVIGNYSAEVIPITILAGGRVSAPASLPATRPAPSPGPGYSGKSS